jgi:hypothetical protein
MKTTIDFNGLRIEHNGGDSVLLISEAPTKIAISDLIDELISLRPENEEGSKSDHSPRQSLCTLPAGSNRIVGLG